jgi:hypothetical protein
VPGWVELAELGDRVHQGEGGVRILGLGEVVRHVHGEAGGVLALLAQAQLEQARDVARHLDVADPGGVGGDQVAAGGVGGHAGRAGVRHGHRDRVHADGHADVVALDQLGDGGDEPLPLDVRLRAGQHQEAQAGGILDLLEHQLRRLERLPVVLHEGHRGTAGPVVVELVDVEGGQHLVLEGVEQVLTGQPAGRARVDEPAEGVDEHRAVQLARTWLILGEGVELSRIEHEHPPR